MKKPQHLSYEEQIDLFVKRGMRVDRVRDVEKLKYINYYKLKLFASPFLVKSGSKDAYYDGISFSDVLTRYYQDKNLRLNMLHAIEKIEVALKTQIAYVLGKKLGAFGYLDFKLWVKKEKHTKYEVETFQLHIKKDILTRLKKADNADLALYENKIDEGFPSIWLVVDLLTFGDIVYILDYMNDKSLKTIANYFSCTTQELISWVKCLKFIRNASAHNTNIIDIKIRTKPKCRKDWQKYLAWKNPRDYQRLAIVLFILVHMVHSINPRYKWKLISNNIDRLIDNKNERARMLGFNHCQKVSEIIEGIKDLASQKHSS